MRIRRGRIGVQTRNKERAKGMNFSVLWIATQDKQSLVNIKEATVNGKKIEGVIGSASLDHWGKVLGKYESNERALEILNEIFMKIDESNAVSVTFTMPEK